MVLFLTAYGLREAALFSLFWIALAAGLSALHPALIAVPAAGWIFTLSFFRDPRRSVPEGRDTLVSPADGRVSDIEELATDEHLGEPSVRVGIFLSVFDVHVNRTPCAGTVTALRYVPGEFLDARHPDCPRRNESQDLVLRQEGTGLLVKVRQVSGAIARRIVCAPKVDDALGKGARYGMIKFGSRTELFVPRRAVAEVCVKVGDKVRGGETILARTR